MEDVIELTPRSRFLIDHDLFPSDPRKEEVICGTYTEPQFWRASAEGPSPTHDFPGNIVEAVDRLTHAEDVIRWAQVFYGLVLQKVGNTYWWCDRTMFDTLHGGDFTRDLQADIIRAEVNEYNHFAHGDGRIISLQRMARFRRTTRKYHDHHADLLEVWETIDSIAVPYIDDEDYTVAVIASDYFESDFNNRERAVIAAMLDEERALHG